MERHYLEYSDPNGSEHKFYEVTLEGSELTVRYGRIGTEGQKQVKTFADAAKARAEAARKLSEKRRKGYEDAVEGVRTKRAVTRRVVQETATTKARVAPVLWRFGSTSSAFGIFVDDQRAWVGNQNGEVYALSLEGETELKFQLPEGVKCLVRDDRWIFAGCDDGNVYDLSGKLPFKAYEVDERVSLYWLDIAGGLLGVSDSDGNVYAFDAESDEQWGNVDQGAAAGWMVRVDERGVYHGHSRGVAMYDRVSGMQLWSCPTRGSVLFGWQEQDDVYAATSANLVQRFSKAGEHRQDYRCDAAIFSCATSPGGEYVFAGDSSAALYCFARDGRRLWKLGSGLGSALSMQYHGARLYVVTTRGYLAAIDASEAAIAAAEQGSVPQVRDVKLQAAVTARTPQASLEITRDASEGILLECILESGKLRVQPRTPGYHADWNVQFPRDLREAGARYVVDALHEINGFYRVSGDIRRLEA
ncbi:outer membrane protein assembly factor BamB [Deinobacterium chartae]|uniref:Outer membrane protein assembly factor BamB n=1 Tax=Deinobacterium chartae TaxID=521158 RepID=A0A841HZX1_9DEIO|nr:WGR domain-containing protein [Deinobacterium chartae]MBB6098947.1 outer membrane protein assembly factor BamB [Deinobacterium chartae]